VTSLQSRQMLRGVRTLVTPHHCPAPTADDHSAEYEVGPAFTRDFSTAALICAYPPTAETTMSSIHALSVLIVSSSARSSVSLMLQDRMTCRSSSSPSRSELISSRIPLGSKNRRNGSPGESLGAAPHL
jgi:hypothetical protein